MKSLKKVFLKFFSKFWNKGFIGEQIAALYLIDKGYEIVERNWRCKIGEIDIVAKKDGFLCFIEVKRKTKSENFKAEDHFDWKKKKKLERLIEVYLKKNKTNLPPRLELVAINEEKGKRKINHYVGL
jgi:putative endonuclease